MNLGKILGAATFALTMHHAASAAIISPIAATATSTFGGTAFYNISDTHNQNGLTINFVSGVTDFDDYIALNPLHTNIDVGFEWFSEDGDGTPVVNYDFGSVQTITGLALWNEEFAGFGTGVVSTSTDGTNYLPLITITDPTDNGLGEFYAADVFAFAAVSAQFVRFELSNCPQPNGTQDFLLCGIGEVAFNAVSAPVPGPGTLVLLASALLGLRSLPRKRAT